MKNLTIGKRIYLGFTALIVIMVILGLLAVTEMGKIAKGANRLEAAYIPEVIVATEVERNLILAMFENRGFGFTEDRSYYEKGKAYSDKVITALGEARTLASEQDLPKMENEVPVIHDAATKYFASADATAGIIEEMAGYRNAMDHQTEVFHGKCIELLRDIQGELATFNKGQQERMHLVNELQARGEKARTASLRGISTDDADLLRESMGEMQEVLTGLPKLAGLLSSEASLNLFANLEGAVNDFMASLAGYQQEFEKGTLASPARLANLLGKVDESSVALGNGVRLLMDGLIEEGRMVIEQRVAQINLADETLNTATEAEVDVLGAQAFRKPELMESAIAKLVKVEEFLTNLLDITEHPEEIDLVNELYEASVLYQSAIEDFSTAYSEIQGMNAERVRLANIALSGSQGLSQTGADRTIDVAKNTVDTTNLGSTLILFGLVLALGLGILLAIFITKSITRPLLEAISNISNGANETKNASSQVSSASQSLAEGASEQAASLEETSSSMEEMTSMVARNAEVATKTSVQAREARSAAEDGVKSMGELRERADTVSGSAKEMESAMQAIKQSSDSISKIIKTIDEIAFQTNILALNAAVEAARAGEAGAGFAVVADEVRSLARRAAEAAQETASMIEDSMERSDRGVQVNETVGRNLQDVLEKANQVEEGLRNITGIVTNVNGAMDELEASVREQQDGISQINSAVGQVNEVTQANAASAEEAASASEQMNAQSVSMMDIVESLTEMVRGKRTDESESKRPARKVQPRAKPVVPQRKAIQAPEPVKKGVDQPKPKRLLKARPAKAAPQASKKATKRAPEPVKTFSLPGDPE